MPKTQKPGVIDEGSIRSDTIAFMKSIGLGGDGGVGIDLTQSDFSDARNKSDTIKKITADPPKKARSELSTKARKQGAKATHEPHSKSTSSEHVKGSKGARWGKGAKLKRAELSVADSVFGGQLSTDVTMPPDGVMHWWRKRHPTSGGLMLSIEGDAHWFDFIPKGICLL